LCVFFLPSSFPTPLTFSLIASFPFSLVYRLRHFPLCPRWRRPLLRQRPEGPQWQLQAPRPRPQILRRRDLGGILRVLVVPCLQRQPILRRSFPSFLSLFSLYFSVRPPSSVSLRSAPLAISGSASPSSKPRSLSVVRYLGLPYVHTPIALCPV
jgi:hypothetical protein